MFVYQVQSYMTLRPVNRAQRFKNEILRQTTAELYFFFFY
jgi:hypothetical protein